MSDLRRTLARQGLVRSDQHRILGGVSDGLGRRLGVGPWAARLLLLLLLVVLPGSSILIYPILWILMPSEAQSRSYEIEPPPRR